MKITKIITIIIIALTFIFVGNPTEYNCFELNLVTIVLGSAFSLYVILKEKDNLFSKKIDYLILLFCGLPIIQIVMGSASCFEKTLMELTKTISILNLYLILNYMTRKDAKFSDWLIKVLIFGGVFLIIFGIDERLSKILYEHINIFRLSKLENTENRMISTIGYANQFAVIMAIDLLLSLRKSTQGKKIYVGISYLFTFGLLMSYSRATTAIFVVLYLLYVIFSKGKRKYIVYTFTSNLIFSFFTIKIFEIVIKRKLYFIAWASVLIFAILSIAIAYVIAKKYKVLYKIKPKHYMITIGIAIIVIIIVYFVGKQLTLPLYAFDGKESETETGIESESEIRYDLFNIEKNQKYKFVFDLEASDCEQELSEASFAIVINEENKYYDTINTHEVIFGNYKGEQTIEFTPQNETEKIVIYIRNISLRHNGKLKINSLYVNDKLFGLNYLYLPVQLVNRIDSFSLKNKCVWERFVFYKDALKLIKENFLLGYGAEGWQYNYQEVQSYRYYTTEVHNFILQIFINYGILGFVLLLIILVYSIFKIIKFKKINEITVALFLLILHSMFDFDMSFYLIDVIGIILYILAVREDKQLKIVNKRDVTIEMEFVFILLNIIAIFSGICSYKIELNNSEIIKNLQTCVYNDNGNKPIELIKELDEKRYKDLIISRLKQIDYTYVNEQNLEYVYNFLEKQKIVVNTENNINRNKTINKVIMTTTNKEIKEKFCKLIIRENEEMVYNINDKEKNRFEQSKISYFLNEQEKFYNRATEELETDV